MILEDSEGFWRILEGQLRTGELPRAIFDDSFGRESRPALRARICADAQPSLVVIQMEQSFDTPLEPSSENAIREQLASWPCGSQQKIRQKTRRKWQQLSKSCLDGSKYSSNYMISRLQESQV